MSEATPLAPEPAQGPTEATTASFEQADKQLHKTMGFNHLLFMSIGAIIGSGWLLASLKAAGTAGPAAILSWIIGGIFIIFVALAYMEVSGMLPRTGGIVRYPVLSHGAFTGWIIGWAYFLASVSVPAIEAEAVITYLGGKFPSAHLANANGILLWPAGILCGIGLMVIFFLLNFFGIRLMAEFNRWIVWWKLVIPTATFCFLFTILHGHNFMGYGGFKPLGLGPIFEALSTSGIIFAYLGFRQALEYAGEAKRPQRDVPLALIGSVVITTILYALLQAGFIGAMNWHAIGLNPGNWAGLLGPNNWKDTPLYSALNSTGIAALTAFATLLLIDAGISPSGTGWIYTGTSTRTYYGLSIHGFFPRQFQWMNAFGIPWISLLGSFIVGCIFFIPAPSWYELVGFITSATALTYIMGGIGLMVFRRTAPNLYRPFRLGWHQFWAPVSFLAASMIVLWSGYSTVRAVIEAVFFGLPLFTWLYMVQKGWTDQVRAYALGLIFLGAFIWTVFYSSLPFWLYDIAMSAAVLFFCFGIRQISNAEGRRHVDATWWLIWMILASLPITFFSSLLGPLKSPPLTFAYGSLVMVGVGLVAYFWGVASGFETAEIREIVGSGIHLVPGGGGGPEEGEEPAAAAG